MATLVKFVKNEYGITAVFPQIKHNKVLFGNDILTCYAHLGQHSSCDKGWVKESTAATESEYQDLKQELESIGYNLKIVKT